MDSERLVTQLHRSCPDHSYAQALRQLKSSVNIFSSQDGGLTICFTYLETTRLNWIAAQRPIEVKGCRNVHVMQELVQARRVNYGVRNATQNSLQKALDWSKKCVPLIVVAEVFEYVALARLQARLRHVDAYCRR